MMCGISGSGKSTLAQNLSSKHNATILSSDEIRKEILSDITDQSDNRKVFEVMNDRAKTLLENGNNIIYDATNTSRKRRVHLINNELNAKFKTVYFMNQSYDMCVYNDEKRDRKVGESIILKMHKNIQIPVKNEGWDDVIFVNENSGMSSIKTTLELLLLESNSHKEIMGRLAHTSHNFKKIYDLPQDSRYHSLSVSRHTYHVYTFIHNKTSDLKLLWAALLHDTGKGLCKSFVNHKGETTIHANFIGHEFSSSQIASYYLNKLGYDDHFIKDVSALCQFHMYPMKAGNKKMKEIERLLGDNLFDDLLLLHEADLQAK